MIRGTIYIDPERCKGCELCVTVCPQDVIVMDTSRLTAKDYHPAILSDPNNDCTGCAVCAVICPDVCITVYRESAKKRTVAVV